MWKDSIRNNVVIFQPNILRIVRFYVRHSAYVSENCQKMKKSPNYLKMEDFVKCLWTSSYKIWTLEIKLFCPIVNRVSGICQAHCLPKMHHSWDYVEATAQKNLKSYSMLKVRQSRKQIMVSSIHPQIEP